MSLFGPPDIQKLVNKLNYTGVFKATRYRGDPAIRIRAIEALADGRLVNYREYTQHVPAITVVLVACAKNDPEPSVQKAALDALCKTGLQQREKFGKSLQANELVKLFSYCQQKRQDALAAQAVEALNRFSQVKDLFPTVGEAKKHLLEFTARQLSLGKVDTAVSASRLLMSLAEENAIGTMLLQYTPEVRIKLMRVLFTQADVDGSARVAASIGCHEAIPLLLEHVSLVHPEVTKALASLGAKEAVVPILDLLPINGSVFKYTVEINAIRQLADASIVEVILNRIRQNTQARYFEVLVALLAEIGKRNLSWLTNALSMVTDEREWEVLLRAVSKTKDSNGVPSILEQAGLKPRAQILPEIMVPFNDNRFVPFLVRVLNDQEAPARREAAEALADLLDPVVVPALVKAVGDSNEPVARAAAHALERQYKNKSLSQSDKQMLLQAVGQLNQQHKDSYTHYDEGYKGAISDCTHTDSQNHADQGPRIQI